MKPMNSPHLVLDRKRMFYCGKAGFCQNSSLSSSKTLLGSIFTL